MTFATAAVFSMQQASRPRDDVGLQKHYSRRQQHSEDPFQGDHHRSMDIRATSRSSKSKALGDRRLPQSRSTIFDRPKFVTPSPFDYDTDKPFQRPNNAHAFSSVAKEVSKVTVKTELPGPGSYEAQIRSSLRRKGVAKMGLKDLFPKKPSPLPGPGEYDFPLSTLKRRGVAPIGNAPKETKPRDASPGPLSYFVRHNDSFSKNGSKVHLPRVGRNPDKSPETNQLGPGEYRFTRFIQNQLRMKGAVSFDRYFQKDPLVAKRSLPGPAKYEIASSFDSMKPHSFAAIIPRSGMNRDAGLLAMAGLPRYESRGAEHQHHHSSSAGVRQSRDLHE